MTYLKTCSMNWEKSTRFIQITSYLLQVEKISKMKIHYSRLLPKQVYAPSIVDWTILNTMGCAETIEEMLKIKVIEMGGNEKVFSFEAWRRAFDIRESIYTELCHEFFSTFEFDKEVTGEELTTKKIIRISGEDQLRLYRSATQTIRSPIMIVLQKMITYGLFGKEERYGYTRREYDCLWAVYDEDCEEVQLLADDVLDGLIAPILCRSLDATTLKELISHDRRLIIEDQALGFLRFAIPRPSCSTLQDLSDRMGRIEIRQGVLERTSYRQLYHSDRYASVFEYMAGDYEVQLAGDYAPQDYDEQ
ncbi:hypothetical protein Tco_0327834 [Tanacetum coccineum]